MKAYQVTEEYSIASLALIEKDIPTPKPDEVVVKMQAVSLNYRDLLVIKGVDSWKPPVGRVPVSDGVGIVVEVGKDVISVKKESRVAGLFLPHWIEGKLTAEKLLDPPGGRARDGFLQQYVVLREKQLIEVPSFLSNEEAATLPVAAITAWHALIEKGQIKAGDTVVIQGTGGVSLFSIQFALMAGARVILLSGSDEKLKLASALGVHHLINYKHRPHWEKEVLEITNGAGADHIVEIVGGSHINRSIDAIAIDGTISIIGLIGGFTGEIETRKLMSKQIRLQGVETGSKEMFTRMNKAIELNKIHPVIDKVYDFEEARQALSSLEKSAHFGKIAVRFS
jgi:NADPH:quinone reductase-like Zn-dependent oxidoreductase